jgi:hypothetical protein
MMRECLPQRGRAGIICRRYVANAMVLLLPIGAVSIGLILSSNADPIRRIPLAKAFVLQALGERSPNSIKERIGQFQIIERNDIDSKLENGFIEPTYSDICAVDLIGISGTTIVGHAYNGYFIIDTHNRSRLTSLTKEEFDTEIRGSSKQRAVLQPPQDVGKELSDRVVRPWAFRQLGGLGLISDATWATLVICLGGSLAIASELFLPGQKGLGLGLAGRQFIIMVAAAVIAIVVNEIANGWIIDTGPDHFIGLFTLPPAFVFASQIARPLRHWIYRKVVKRGLRLRARGKSRGSGVDLRGAS